MQTSYIRYPPIFIVFSNVLLCHATITDCTVDNLVALPIIQCVNAWQFSCPSKQLKG